MTRIRAILYGIGKIGVLATRLMIEKGVDVVAAIDRPRSTSGRLGRDLGDVAGLGRTLGVAISDDAEHVLSSVQADIVFVAVADDMERMYPIYERCLRHGFNVITVGSEASFSWRSAPDRTQSLHRLAIENGVTLCGSGNQDFFMVNAASLASGICHRLGAIAHVSLTDVNDFGAEVAALSHVGETPEDYRVRVSQAKAASDSVYLFFWENLCADLGFTITGIDQSAEPLFHDSALRCRSLERDVRPGQVVGVRTLIEIATLEKVSMRGEYMLRLCAPGEHQFKSWRLVGEPNLELEFKDLNPGFTTVTQPVNRIPDVINSEPGYVTIEKLPKLKYRAKPLDAYLLRRGASSRA